MPRSKRTAHYVASTHWDREWYESFQDYRFRLVSLMDELLDQMAADPEYRYFQSDGQSIVWDDYLEIRPERREQVVSLAREGRLRIGPWYVMPDEFIVSGESLVRNLQMGLRTAARFGAPSRAGFICDIFGHTSQLPQILRGFSIDNAFVWRGVLEKPRGAVFRWQSPDGSEVIAYRFSPRYGYCSYAFLSRKCNQIDHDRGLDEAMKGLREQLDFEMDRCPTPSLLIFDGGDHMEIEPRTTQILRRANKAFTDVELIHSHLDGFVEDLREQRSQITRVIQGELREIGEVGDEGWLIPGVLSSRIHLKQQNAQCETELCLWAEPFSTFAALLGDPYPVRHLQVAWRWLLQNHPHDSICACSIDQVHKDMEYRFDQSRLIASHLTRDALQAIAARVELPEMGDQDMAVVVFNPSTDPIDGPVDLTLRFPKDLDTIYQEFFGFEPKIGFRLYDTDGNEVAYQYVNWRRERVGFRRRRGKFPQADIRHEVDITAALKVPAYGYTRLVCRPVKGPTRYLGTMVIDDHTIENEHLQVSVAANGTLSLRDTRTGQVYERLLTVEDRADIGDGWYHGVAVNDEIHSSIASAADVAVIADGIHKATLKIRVTLQVPGRFDFDSMRRGTAIAPLVITHHVTLRHSSDHVEVRTEIENTIRDHRVRVLFPTGAKTDTYLADSAFDVVERAIALRADNAKYKELEVETRPQQTWTAAHDDTRGLAVVATGLPESTVRDLPERPIALTLLRSFIKAVLTSGNEGGEIQGRHEFRFLIVPLAGRPDWAGLCRLGQKLAAGVRTVQIERHDAKPLATASPSSRSLPPALGFLKVASAQTVVTAVQRAGDKEVASIRLFNPTPVTITTAMALHDCRNTGELTDLEGKSREPIKSSDRGAEIQLTGKQIATVRFTE
ncbi:MAG TPA: glycoside hydrolase family 38 C-terminal domain-containing protein [Phycisphaerae bacterium]|nr:glycoside hydrolase family 38 C-terminal domain-containing protein [Phycisphaerae bacterium]HRY69889.1 glycoside hydrolase family 38 C-terminal domain-containing protein [Phycisphaerae bacterium]